MTILVPRPALTAWYNIGRSVFCWSPLVTLSSHPEVLGMASRTDIRILPLPHMRLKLNCWRCDVVSELNSSVVLLIVKQRDRQNEWD